jgi:biotin operon repressor
MRFGFRFVPGLTAVRAKDGRVCFLNKRKDPSMKDSEFTPMASLEGIPLDYYNETAREIAVPLRLYSDEIRLHAMMLLGSQGPSSVPVLADLIGVTPTSLMHHLRMLKVGNQIEAPANYKTVLLFKLTNLGRHKLHHVLELPR